MPNGPDTPPGLGLVHNALGQGSSPDIDGHVDERADEQTKSLNALRPQPQTFAAAGSSDCPIRTGSPGRMVEMACL